MRFADYFGRAFASVTAAQFPWVKIFKESTVGKLIDVSFSFTFSSFVSIQFNAISYTWPKKKKKSFLALLSSLIQTRSRLSRYHYVKVTFFCGEYLFV